MAVKIRLKRMGKIRAPFYRVVIMDSRTKRDGRAIEEIGKYHPTNEPSLIDIDIERVRYWLGVGAQPTEQVLALLKITGDWQKFKGLPGAEGTLKVAPAKASKKDLYEAAMAAAGKADDEHAKNPTPRERGGRPDEAAAGSADAATPAAEETAPPTDPADAEPAKAQDVVAEAVAANAEGEATVEAGPSGAEAVTETEA